MQQIDQRCIQIIGAAQSENVAVIPKDYRFHLMDARMKCLSIQPQVPIQAAFAWHCRGELHLCLKDDPGLDWEFLYRSELPQCFQEKLVQLTDDWLFPYELIF